MTTVGPYELLRRLGAGGMGEVFLAWDERLQRHVAIKRLRSDLRMTAARKKRFRREAQAAARLSHPAIVQVHDFLADPDGDAIVMEYVAGSTLAQLVAEASIDVRTALRVARQIAEGLAKAHEMGFVHRDLKAENVMITPPGEVKVLDFGLAKVLGHSELDGSLTRDGAVLGTVRAMSPEQASGFEIDARSDLYSLGILLYEMLTGLSPYRGETAQQIHRKVLTERPPPPRALRPDLPEDLSRLVESLLEKDPDRRPRDAQEVIAALQVLEALPLVEQLGPPPDVGGQHLPSEASTRPDPDGEAPVLDPARPAQRFESSSKTSSYSPRRAWRGLSVAVLVLLVSSVVGWKLAEKAGQPVTASEPVELPPTSYELYQEGMRYLERFDREGYIDKAIEVFTKTIALDPTYAPAFSALGRAYWRRWRSSPDPVWLNQASENARIAVDMAPQLSHARVTLALVQMARGELEPARLTFEDVLRLDPGHADAYRALADLAVKNSDDEEALRLLREAIRCDPGNWYLHSSFGRRLQLNGEYEDAITAFEASLEVAPDNALTHLSLAAIYHFQGRFADAATALQRSLEIQPSAKVYSNLGTLYFFQGKAREAATAFEQAVNLGANKEIFWANLADAYRMIPGKEPDAADAYLQAIDLVSEELRGQPNQMDLRSRLALYRARRGDRSQALAEVAKLEPLAERNAHTVYRAALVFELCGDRDRAFQALELALESGYSFSETRQEPDLVELREDIRYRQLALKLQDRSAARPR